ncbi:MAG: DUF460 domain-containing protein [Candidatus Nezhaarchaeota archaeon]|nr:DUF460 domain-containing protein [Candidatus Nezhaarchaeota archaeon]
MLSQESLNKQRMIMGLDLTPSLQTREYALAIVNEKGFVLDRRDRVDWKTVLRLLKKYQVDTIAVDNIYEIGESINEVRRRLSKVIDRVRLVEVTRIGEHHVKLVELAFKEGLLSERVSHLSPLQAAEVSALLALKGMGTTILEPSTVRTAIIISRGRSLGPGGMSQGRYSRAQLSAVRQVTSLLLDELRKHIKVDEIEYYVQRSRFGFERSIILLDLSPFQVKKLLKPLRDLIKKSGVNIKIVARIPVLDEKQIGREDHEDRPIIVGLDPGIVTGVAVIDLSGNLLFVNSGLALDKMTVVETITKFGNPVVIASDVRRTPVIVEKIASLLGCIIYSPPRDLSVDEKRRMIQEHIGEFKNVIKNTHQRDAVAAALKAYLNFKNKFMQLEAKAKELNLTRPQMEKAKALLIKGLTIKEALERVMSTEELNKSSTSPQVDPEVQKLKQELSKLRDKIEEQSKIIKELEESRLRLLNQLREREAIIEKLEEKLMKVPPKVQEPSQEDEAVKRRLELSMKTIGELRSKVENLEKALEALKNLVKKIAKGDVVIIKEIRAITKRSIEEAVKHDVLSEGEIVLIQDPSSSNIEGFHQLLKVRPEAIIVSINKIPEEIRGLLEENCIPLIDVEEVKIERVLDFLYTSSTIKDLIKIKRDDLLSKKDRNLRKKFMEMLQRYREERARELVKG